MIPAAKRLSELQDLLKEAECERDYLEQEQESTLVQDEIITEIRDEIKREERKLKEPGKTVEMRTSKPIFKRVSLSLDLSTIKRCKELANEQSQSVSSLIRYIVGQIYEQKAFRKSRFDNQVAIDDFKRDWFDPS